MAWEPTADDSRKFSHLQGESAVAPRRDSEGIFIHAGLSAEISRIEPAVEARLSEEVNVRPSLSIEKKAKSRSKEVVPVRSDQSWRGLREMVILQIE